MAILHDDTLIALLLQGALSYLDWRAGVVAALVAVAEGVVIARKIRG